MIISLRYSLFKSMPISKAIYICTYSQILLQKENKFTSHSLRQCEYHFLELMLLCKFDRPQ